jgi:DNA/RNA endonuclease YhcR with UshA esterase domain
MKWFLALLVLSLASVSLLAAEISTNNTSLRINSVDAKEHIGSKAIVTGTVAEVYKAEKLIRLNFEKPFPKQPFTAVVFANKTNLFADLDSFKGKRVEVAGKITEYRDRPEMVLTNAMQIKILDEAPVVEKK